MSQEVLYSIIGALCIVIGVLLKIGMSGLRSYIDAGFSRVEECIKGLSDKMDRMEERQARIEKDCVTWLEFEKMNTRFANTERRLTIVETVCQQRHLAGSHEGHQ